MFKALFFLVITLPFFTLASDEMEWPTHSITLTYGVSFHDSSIQLGTRSGGGFIIDTEDTLGLKETQSSIRLNYDWRFSDNKKHIMAFSWYQYHRSGRKVLAEDIKYEDKDGNEQTIPTGTLIDSVFNFDIIRLFYAYSFFLDDRINLSGGAGFYVMPIEVGVGESGQAKTKNSFVAPLPTFKLKAEINLTQKWILNSELNLFYIKIGSFSGKVFSNNLYADYRFDNDFFLGLGIEAFKIDIKLDEDNTIFESDLDGRVILANQSLLMRLRYDL
ncbi:hypothetical protein [Halobacteriovorax sp. YZS-1-1]|uniref:hypothetical protein n=1 Tax=unclassified Halobacteriovorax TaxID=2639665 RepID=UPI00399A01C7